MRVKKEGQIFPMGIWSFALALLIIMVSDSNIGAFVLLANADFW